MQPTFRLKFSLICRQIWHENSRYLPKICSVCGPPCILRESLKSRLGVEELGNWAAGWIVINASNNPLLPINRPGARPMDLWAGRPSVPSKHAPHYQPLCTGVGTGIPLNNATYVGLCVLSVALILLHLPFNTLQPHLHKGTSVHI